MPKRTASAFISAFKSMAVDPAGYVGDIKQLSGRKAYRLRIGDYRAIYEIQKQEIVIFVLDIRTRGDVYK